MPNFYAGNIRGCVRAVNGVPVFAPVAAISGASGKSFLQRGQNSGRNQRAIVRASAATVSSKSASRRPREENVEGDFYVDHTCIGNLANPWLHVFNIRVCFLRIIGTNKLQHSLLQAESKTV